MFAFAVCLTSWTFVEVVTTVCASSVSESTPICALYPKCQTLPFLVWWASLSRFWSAFFVELGASKIAESTIVPFFQNKFFFYQQFDNLFEKLLFNFVLHKDITKRTNVSQSGISVAEIIPQKPENARLSATSSAAFISGKS
jgi:hypothetical protein